MNTLNKTGILIESANLRDRVVVSKIELLSLLKNRT
jgi:hypothetical protein